MICVGCGATWPASNTVEAYRNHRRALTHVGETCEEYMAALAESMKRHPAGGSGSGN